MVSVADLKISLLVATAFTVLRELSWQQSLHVIQKSLWELRDALV